MGPGKRPLSWFEREPEIPTQIPKNFWTMSPRDAALSLAETNRLPEHKRMYRLAIDDLGGQKPPQVCSVLYWNYYEGIFLRSDPKDSYFVFVGSKGCPRYVWGKYLEPYPCRSLLYLKLHYKDAKRIADTIWWLNRVRSFTADRQRGATHMGSTHEGFGQLKIISGSATDIVNEQGIIWSSRPVSDHWMADYNKQVFLNLAAHIIQKESLCYLKGRYPAFESETGWNLSEFAKSYAAIYG